jgi:PAS domain S-box-containing protein
VLAALTLATGMSLAQQPAAGSPPDSAAPVPVTGTHVVAAVLRDWQPEFTTKSNGEPGGFAIDILAALAKRAGLEVGYRQVSTWNEALDLLRRGSVDLIPNLGVTVERTKWISVTWPVETFPVSIFIRRATHGIAGLSDLSGRVVAVVNENAAIKVLANRTNASLRRFTSPESALLALLSGQVDAVAYPVPILSSLARRIGIEQRIRVLEPPLTEIKRGLAVRRENHVLMARLEAAMQGFVGSPEYRAIYVRWYGEKTPYWKERDLLWIVGAAFLLIAGAALAWHYLRVIGLNRRLVAAGAAHERALQALQASESRYRELIEGSELAIMIGAMDGRRLFVNRAFARLLGYGSPDELLGLPFGNAVVAPHDRERVTRLRETVLKTGEPASYEFDAMRKDGMLVPAQAFVQRIVWGGEYAIERTLIDLRERRRTESALRDSEMRFRHIFEASGAGVFIRSMEGLIVDANQAVADMLGYKRRELIGKNVLDLAPPEDFEDAHARINQIARGERNVINIERRFLRRDGSTIWAIINVAVARDPSGAPSFVVTTVRDISERKLAEETLAESEMRYRHMIERFPLGISIYGEDGSRLFLNEAFAHLLGYESAEAVMAAPRGSLLPREDRDAIRKRKADSFSAGADAAPHEMRLIRKDGTHVHVQAFTRRIVWAGRAAVQRTFIDLTERRQAEAALRESEERFRTTFEAGGAGMTLCSSAGRYLRVNKAFCDLVGYPSEEIIGRTPLDFAHPDERETTARFMAELESGTSAGYLREKHVLRKDGSSVWTIVCVVVTQNSVTGERYQIGIIQDITERKLAEEALAESEMRYRQMFERFPLGIQIFDWGGNRVFANDAYARLVGYSSAQEVMGAPPGIFTPPGERSRLRPRLARLSFEPDDPAPEEIRFRQHNGTDVPVQAFSRRVMWAGREAIQRTYVDLTERRQAEAALRTSEEQFRTVFEASGAGMVLCDIDGRFRQINKAFCDLVGYTAAEIVGRSVLDLTHPDDREETAETTRLLKRGDETRHIREKRFISKNGDTVWAIVCVVVVRNAATGEPYQIGILQDITERKQAEKALADSTARLVNAQRIARIGDWERDLATERLVWSDEVYRIFGIEPGTVMPTFQGFYERFVHPEDRAMVAERARHSLATGEPLNFDHRIIGPGGEVRIVHEDGEVTFGPDGKPVRFAGTVQDVTELRQAKQALEASETRFRGVFEAGGAAIVLADGDGHIYDFNRAFADFVGYDEHELRSCKIYDFMHPDDVAFSAEQRQAIFAGEIARYQAERRYVRKDGTVLWASVNVTAMPQGVDEQQILIAIIQDITQRKLSEAALAEKSKLLDLMRGLAESANQAASFAEAVQLCLDRVCAYTGFPVGHAFIRSEIDPDILRPMLIWHLDDEERFSRYRSATEQMVLRIGVGVPGRVIATGDVAWTSSIPVDPSRPTIRSDAARAVGFKSGFATPVMAGSRIVGVLEFYTIEVMPRDEGIVEVVRQAGTELGRVYEREQAQKDARRREEQLRQIIDNVPHWIYVKDRDGRYLLANKTLVSTYGLTIDDVIGHTQQEILHDDAEAARILAHDRSVIATGQVSTTPSGQFRAADGSIRNVRITKMPYTTQTGELAVLGIAEDVTEQIAAENELRRAQRMDALGKMTGGVAHDFNNLLTIILGNLQLLERRLKDDALRSLAETAERAARRGADVTRRLLAFARSQPLEPRSIDLNDMVRDMTALVERSLGPTIEIETALPENLWKTRPDPGQVENALLNLVINSRDAMPDGGRLMIETSNVTLTAFERRPGALEPGDYVTAAVADTGIGMSEEVIARAVEPFFTTKDVGKGSGLGLSMIYGFVRQSGGDMTIESEQGKGTTVRLYLPRVFAPAPVPAEQQPARSARGRETVLLVEDDPDVREFARVALSSLDYRVIEADSGTAALNLLGTAGPVDLLFVDVALPGGVSGLMLAEAVRRRAPGIAVIVTSGDPDAARDHAAAPGIAFLRKPYTQGDLATIMRAALDRRERVEV